MWCARARGWRLEPCLWLGPHGLSTSRWTPGTAAAHRPPPAALWPGPQPSGPGAPVSRTARPYPGCDHRCHPSPRVRGRPAGSSTLRPVLSRRSPASPNMAGKSCAPKCSRTPRAPGAPGCRFNRSNSCRGKPTLCPPPARGPAGARGLSPPHRGRCGKGRARGKPAPFYWRLTPSALLRSCGGNTKGIYFFPGA